MLPGGFTTIIAGPEVAGVTKKADNSLKFTENDIPVSGETVRDLIMDLSGTKATTLAEVTRVTLRAGQVPFVDTLPAYIRAWLGWVGKKAEWATTADGFVFPLHGYRGWSAPPGQGLSIQIGKSAVMEDPVLTLHEGLNKEEPSQGFMYFLSSAFNLAASKRQTIQITTPGKLVGLVIPTPADIDSVKLYDVSGLVAEITNPRALQASEFLYQGTTVTDPLYWKMPIERLVTTGVTRLELVTGAGWVDGEFGFHTVIEPPQK